MSLVQHDALAEVAPDGARGVLLDVSYRMLGSLAEAEDAVQEAYARWYALEPSRREEIARPTAWLVRVATRVCLDVLGSARARREKYVGTWLPEPLPGPARWSSQSSSDAAGAGDPADRVTLDESLGMAFLVVLETTSPAERVSFVLHDVFAFPFDEVASVLDRSPAACRRLASSARRKMRDAHVPTSPPARVESEAVSAFRRARETGDIEALLAVLDPEASVLAARSARLGWRPAGHGRRRRRPRRAGGSGLGCPQSRQARQVARAMPAQRPRVSSTARRPIAVIASSASSSG